MMPLPLVEEALAAAAWWCSKGPRKAAAPTGWSRRARNGGRKKVRALVEHLIGA
jgi:hypothetical protein